ncbi:MAG: glycosyltransferase family 4 protein, partial [Actinobacteria bacterium]|nr:glycosyltransferase family 4 protein [Actinomycetota bacterium]
MSVVHLVVPEGVDDPGRASGGNVYDRRVGHGLADAGWTVCEHPVPGPWPGADERGALARELASVPDGGVVLVDGLVASGADEAVVPETGRLRVVVLVHLPLGATTRDAAVRAAERRALAAASAVLATSGWSRRWLLEEYVLAEDRVHVAEPGVDRAAVAPGSDTGGRLLCVAALTPGKGYDVLVDALAEVGGGGWRCVCVGSVTRDPAHVTRVAARTRDAGLAGRVQLVGPLTGRDLEASYAAADVLVLASRFETFGMVVAEALAHGLPVITTSVGGLPDTLG